MTMTFIVGWQEVDGVGCRAPLSYEGPLVANDKRIIYSTLL